MSDIQIPVAPPIIKKEVKKKNTKPKTKKYHDDDGNLLTKSGKPDLRQKTGPKNLENAKIRESMDKVKQAEIERKAKERLKAEQELSSSEESEYEGDDYEILEYVVKKKREPIEVAPEFIKEVEVIKEVPVDREVIKEVIKEVPVEKEVIKEVQVPVELPLNRELVQQNQSLRHALFMNTGLEDINYIRGTQKYKKRY
jgi:hypothetical protein